MRRVLLVTLSTALALTTTACDFGGGDTGTDTTVSQSPSVVSVPTTQPSPTPTSTPVGRNQARGIVLPDLISSTDPNQRVQQIESNRPDPFALIPTTPTIELTRDANGQPIQQQPTSSPFPGTASAPRTPSRNTQTSRTPSRNTQTSRAPSRNTQTSRSNRSPNRPGTLAPIPNLVGRAPTTPIAPPPPSPDLARAVLVSGVVQIGNTAFAIVNAPNEPNSRYVKAGQRLSNGQVLVRRIEMNAGSEPVVVLEQYGVEVVRSVESGAPSPSATPAASVPGSNGDRSA
ncbi:MAG TPA: hypothetical protein V6D10_12790 [Trichocoleus sp.]